MTRWIFRTLVGLAFALPAILIGVAFARAEPVERPAETDRCYLCHADSYKVWDAGGHGRAAADEAFQTLWEAQGKPERCLACHTTGYDAATGTYETEGVACAACHSPIPDDHPDEPIPTDRSVNACGQCHVDTMLEWQVSQHREQDLTCASCHDPHAADIKAENASELCGSCHKEQTSKFSHTEHSLEGVDCADCHLAPLDGIASEGHAFRDHSFNVKLSTCNECHADRMHEPVAMPMLQPTEMALDAMASANTMGVSLEPEPVSPMGFAALAAVLGFGIGIVLAPWLERWYRGAHQH